MHLQVAFESVLDVFDGEARIGQVAPSGDDEWAAYRSNAVGNIIQDRIGTFSTIDDAVRAVQTGEVR